MITKIIDILWPIWEETLDVSLETDKEAIKNADWKFDADSCLEEARRLRSEETSRNNTASNKSQIYIAALLGLIPVLLSMTEINFFSQRLQNPDWSAITGMVFFSIGIFYGLFALYYALKTMKVAVFHCVDVSDLVKLSSSKNTKSKLIIEILLSVRNDRSTVNRKVGFVKMTQAHIARMAIMFLASLLFLILWPIFSVLTMNLICTFCTSVQK